MSATTVPAAVLVASGECSPACLLAQEADGKCRCRCTGRYHGALADAEVMRSPSSAWWVACDYAGYPAETVRAMTPIASTVRQENKLYLEAKKAREPFTCVAAVKKGYVVRWDGITLPWSRRVPWWPEREAKLLNRLSVGLLRAGRIQAISEVPCEYFSAYPFRDLDEACVFWLLVNEVWCGNASGVVRAIEVVEGRPDPVSLGRDPERGYPDHLSAALVSKSREEPA